MNQFNVFVLSRNKAEKKIFKADDYIISITDPHAKLADIKGTQNILRLSFYDIDKPLKDLSGETFEPITDSDAYQIVSFVGHSPSDSNIYVHCEAGISRSAGVAAAILRWFGGRGSDEDILRDIFRIDMYTTKL